MKDFGKLAFGVLWMDIQHRQLIEQIEALGSALTEGTDKPRFFETMSFVERYIGEHFHTEEAYMKKLGYPGAERHLAAHSKFIGEFRRFKRNCIYRETESSRELLTRLSDWVLKHIPTEDKSLARFLYLNGCR